MPINSAGVYVLPRNWVSDATASPQVLFDPAKFMEQDSDQASELNRLRTLIATLDDAVTSRITAAIGASPGALSALNELAALFAGGGSTAADLASGLALKAPLASPALTGLPTAPTPTTNDESTKIATTAYVAAKLVATTAGVYSFNGLSGIIDVTTSALPEGGNLYHTTSRAAAAAPVQSVAGKTGAVMLVASDIGDATSVGRAILTAADAIAQRTALGVVIGANVQAYSANLSGWAGIAPAAKLDASAAAASVAWANVTGKPTNVSAFTNDAGYVAPTGTVARATIADNGGVISVNGATGAVVLSTVQDMRLGAEVSLGLGAQSATAASGHLLTYLTIGDNSDGSARAKAKPLQKLVLGTWVTITG